MVVAERSAQSICVVAPFYNEELGVRAFYEALRAVMNETGFEYRFVFVDDGSRDSTLALLSELARHDPRVGVLALARNFGHQIALSAGLDYAEADLVVMMDSDLQHPPRTILEMIAAYQRGADIVYAVRDNSDQVSLGKRFFSQAFYSLMRRATQVTVVPNAPDFRLMTRDALDALRQMRETHRYLRGMVAWIGFQTAQVKYHQASRYAGKPSFHWRQSLRMAYHAIFSFSTLPLQLITWTGLLMTFMAFIYLLYTLYIYFVERTPLQGWTSLIVVVLIVGGVQLISIGVLAQYVGMIFEQVKQRPLYTLRQTYNLEQKS
jgi:dolichol-phosphate mannosyltransferase